MCRLYWPATHDPHWIRVASVFEFSACLFSAYWPATHDPQGIRVASVFEFSVCLSVLCKFSPFHSLARSFHFISFISNSKIFAVNSFHSTRRYIGTAVGSLHPALHRNGCWPAPPGVTSERRLEGLCIHFLICCLLYVCNIFTTPRAGP